MGKSYQHLTLAERVELYRVTHGPEHGCADSDRKYFSIPATWRG